MLSSYDGRKRLWRYETPTTVSLNKASLKAQQGRDTINLISLINNACSLNRCSSKPIIIM